MPTVLSRKPGGGGGGGAPSGPAGGDLAGTYPDPTLGTGVVSGAQIDSGDAAAILTALGIVPLALIEAQVRATDGGFDFAGIPATYSHLLILFTGTQSGGGDVGTTLQINGDTGTNYDWQGGGSAAAAATSAQYGSVTGTGGANPGYGFIVFPFYKQTTWEKTFTALSGRSNGGSQNQSQYSGTRRASTAAITRINLITSHEAGSLASLYGIG